MAPLDWLDLSTAWKDISQVKEDLGLISVEKPRLGVDLKRRIAVLRNRNRILKKDRDLHFRRCKLYKLQLDELQKKYDELQNYFVASQLLKKLDESHKEISRLKEIISIREQESSQDLQVGEPFVNGEFIDLQTADASVQEQEEGQIVKVEPQESEGEEEGEEVHQHPYNKSAENVNSAEFEKRVEILDVRSANRELRIHLCRVPQEMCLQNGNSSQSESNLVCKWIHMRKGVCRQEFLHASELESHLKTDHLVTAKRTMYKCRWEDCTNYGHPFVFPGKLISHLQEHVPQISNETQNNQMQIVTEMESNPRSENISMLNLHKSSWGRGLKARFNKQGGKGPFGSLGGHQVAFSSMHQFGDHVYSHSAKNKKSFACPFGGCRRRFPNRMQLEIHDRTHKGKKPFACSYEGCDRKFARKQVLEYHLNWHKGERPFKCPYDGCHWAFADKTNLYSHVRTHTGERPFECTFEGCGRSFKHKCTLQAHWRIHNDERPFQCTFAGCRMRFRQRANQLSHLRVHTRNKSRKRRVWTTQYGVCLNPGIAPRNEAVDEITI